MLPWRQLKAAYCSLWGQVMEHSQCGNVAVWVCDDRIRDDTFGIRLYVFDPPAITPFICTVGQCAWDLSDQCALEAGASPLVGLDVVAAEGQELHTALRELVLELPHLPWDAVTC